MTRLQDIFEKYALIIVKLLFIYKKRGLHNSLQ